jgi:DNA polymerase IV
MSRGASVVHLNVADFPAAVAMAVDRGLAEKAFVIAGSSAGRAIVLGLSPRAREEGLFPGMSLAQAQERVRGLIIVPPDPVACARAGEAMEALAARYAPLIQNDAGGHLYLDLSGTERLFGPPLDSAVRVRNEIAEALHIEPELAVARNKLVAKVAARSVRPSGIAGIREGDEASFLAPQDARLLPGVGPAIARILAVTGLQEIGEIALLCDGEALALFGKRGLALRDAARGLDGSPVEPGRLGERSLRRRADFAEDTIEAPLVRAALIALVEDAGLELRKSLLAARRVRVGLSYSDGFRAEAAESSRRPLLLDTELIAAADRAFSRAATRRVRFRSLGLELSDLAPAVREPDLFIPEGPSRGERIQAAVDSSRGRYGPAAVTRASALVSSHAR